MMGNGQKIVRPREGRKIAGVCQALANFFGLDVNIIRIVWLLAVLLGGTGFLAYLICWLVIPEEGR
ncbi:MAG: PspC domain-containing protein [Bacteroidaceae bacterium]|nr:PspC domain-containing protein [Bacteroidaceae bacterium]